MTFEDVFQQKTQFKAQYIEKKNWFLRTVWTCSIESELKTNKNLQSFFTDYDKILGLSQPISGRSALYGKKK